MRGIDILYRQVTQVTRRDTVHRQVRRRYIQTGSPGERERCTDAGSQGKRGRYTVHGSPVKRERKIDRFKR